MKRLLLWSLLFFTAIAYQCLNTLSIPMLLRTTALAVVLIGAGFYGGAAYQGRAWKPALAVCLGVPLATIVFSGLEFATSVGGLYVAMSAVVALVASWPAAVLGHRMRQGSE
jgi:hypothetical protein